MKRFFGKAVSIVSMALLSASVYAEEVASAVKNDSEWTKEYMNQAFGAYKGTSINPGDTAWVMMSAILVLLMTIPALAIFYGGMVRKKNILSTLYYSLGATISVSILWVTVQYSMVFGGKDIMGLIGGFEKIFMDGVGVNGVHALAPTIPEFAFMAFQLTFAVITVALISGAVVERMNFSAWMIFSVLWSIIVYTPLAHWVWSPDGWLNKLGVLDFAGGYVVEAASGVSALVVCLFIGERVRLKKDRIMPSNVPLVFIGAALLWVGWFGFNAGSAGAANGLAANAFMVTNTSGAIAGLVWMLIEWFKNGKPSGIGMASGFIAGMVAITPAAGFVDIKESLVIGIVAGIVCFIAVVKVKKALGYDDSLDVFGIHGVAGTWGIIATGLFANPLINPGKVGLFHGNPGQLGKQLIGLVAVYALVIIGTLLALLITKTMVKLRVEPQEEIYGLDLVLHGERVEE